ncbi:MULTISPECIES: MaoC family dehydratase [Clostridium]|uniref:3-hydroxybutyryl-CoA dehydratase n=1 Tax=Clostridium cadaveris TaxID=1529 RepID=A0A1I2NJ33_9CLOT|nr:MaoC family dehydratase [Clostridium cadaveris]MDU4952545.1 MaoC family dehydratase [Clostridium sp.]MDM8312913.1 MaoC family dehydratase [Clostridium cadaveris]MDY4948789.1 MaoC family dehydratase [Clostridium cadaveris]NME65515.1 MaoC family dehydratase [Clostridium cadaveris]NWK11914.1 MaoC family dehydratase [Clostridium cadaveris]
MTGKTINEINLGDKASYSRTVTEADVVLFGGVSGDLNPAHFNEEYCKDTMFKGRIAHGMLSSSYISTVLGMQLPGPGTIYLSQELKFTAPVKFGDTVTATIEVIEKIEEKNRIVLDTICTNQDGKVVVKGKAVVMPPK